MLLQGCILLLTYLASMSSVASADVDQSRLKKAMTILEETASVVGDDFHYKAVFSKKIVKGKDVKAMLTDYAQKSGYEEYDIKLRMTASDLPEVDSGTTVIGLAKNIDVVGFAVDISNNLNDPLETKARIAKALKALFEVTGSGALVGVESSGWSVCGMTYPSLIIVDPFKKIVYSLVADDPEC